MTAVQQRRSRESRRTEPGAGAGREDVSAKGGGGISWAGHTFSKILCDRCKLRQLARPRDEVGDLDSNSKLGRQEMPWLHSQSSASGGSPDLSCRELSRQPALARSQLSPGPAAGHRLLQALRVGGSGPASDRGESAPPTFVRLFNAQHLATGQVEQGRQRRHGAAGQPDAGRGRQRL